MKPVWLIERDVFGPNAERFRAEVFRQGLGCFTVDYRPGRRPPDDILGCPPLAADACVILWGTLPLMRQIQLHRRWIPGGWCNADRLECAEYYPHFDRYLLNADRAILTGIDAIAQKDSLFDRLAIDDCVFVRPSSVHKLFAGRVVDRDTFESAIAPSRYDTESRVVIARPKSLMREWRLVVVDKVVVAASQYRDRGMLSIQAGCPAEVQAYAERVLRDVDWRPDAAFMMDICESDDRLFVVELNSFSCSGLYACDLSAVIEAASALAIREHTQHGSA